MYVYMYVCMYVDDDDDGNDDDDHGDDDKAMTLHK